MSVFETFVKWFSMTDEFENSSLSCQGDYFIVSDTQFAFLRFSISMKTSVHESEDLFHDGILPEIVISLALELSHRGSAQDSRARKS